MSTQLRKNPCQSWKLYVITGSGAPEGRSLKETVRLAIDGGASVIQLRDKKTSDKELIQVARELLTLTRSRKIPLIINDRIEVAKISGADGVHLGQEDGPLEKARVLLGKDAIIGRSTHSPEQALLAVQEGFDYIGVGPVFKTPAKPTVAPVGLEFVRFAVNNIAIPFVAIGGIDEANINEVLQAGARCTAVVRAVMTAEDPKKMSKALIRRIENFYGK